MDISIITLDNKGKYMINEEDALVVNLYCAVYSLHTIDKKLYRERIKKASLLLTMIGLGMGVVEDLAILNLTWGVYMIGKIDGEEFDAFFERELGRLHNYGGHARVVDYVNTCLSDNNTTMHFLIPDEKIHVSADKPVEQIDNLCEQITENEKIIDRMVRTARDAVKEMSERLEEAERRLAEKDGELQRVCKENERMRSDTYRNEIGKEYLLKMFKGYLKNAKNWSQGIRDKEYGWLEHLLKLEGIPQGVKDMIESLTVDKGGESVINVNGDATINDIHNNGTVNTK